MTAHTLRSPTLRPDSVLAWQPDPPPTPTTSLAATVVCSLSPANASLLMLVASIASSGGPIGVVGYVSPTTVFLTVATLAGARHPQPDRRNDDAAGADPPSLASGDRPEELLSPRELEVLTIIAEGATNAEIAKRLVIAESTVQSHVKHVLEKLGAKNRTQAAARYLCY